MNVASIETCRELYELSEWECDGKWWSHAESDTEFISSDAEHKDDSIDFIAPAYDLGYLLRKLPKVIGKDFLIVGGQMAELWSCGYYVTVEDKFTFEAIADSPEDAACKLAIELFKQGILTNAHSKEQE